MCVTESLCCIPKLKQHCKSTTFQYKNFIKKSEDRHKHVTSYYVS